MLLITKGVYQIRSLIAALISRFAPRQYKQIIERRHPGVQVVGDETSDVRVLKEQALEHVMRAVETTGLQPLARIDDRACWIVLLSSGDHADLSETLILKLVESGLRVSVSIEGRRAKRITSSARLAALKRRGPLRIVAIRAGIVWMRARGFRQVGWHAAARIHFYDWDPDKGTYCARSAGSLPPMIDKPPMGREAKVAGLSRADTRLDKIHFPIDVVFTWVDGDDSDWNERRRIRSEQLGHHLDKEANSQTRYKNRDELRYSLRSLYYFAPWVRNVFLVTDNQIPSWYDVDSGMLKIISHRDLFPDARSLPTFNSHAIESVLHRIPGLSEHFVYMNDDVFFSSVIHAEAFFEVNGIARTFLSRAMIPFCSKGLSNIASEWGAINANELLYQSYSAVMPYKTKHTPIALRRTLLSKLEATFANRYERLRHSPFRTRDDLAPTSTLHAYFGLREGLVVRGDISYRYINLARPDLKHALRAIAYSPRSMVYCLNDTQIDDHGDFDWDRQERIVVNFLQMMYPYQAPWEKAGGKCAQADVETTVINEEPTSPVLGGNA
jgi:hypothetical protein